MTLDALKAALLADRRAAYARLRGGFPIPLAGAVYWLVVGALGLWLPAAQQVNLAFLLSGAIFPLALLFAAIFRNGFMKDKAATGSALVPAFAAMLLFWPMLVVAVDAGASADAAMVFLAIGMSMHWPVIGWTYGRTALFTGHAIVRAAAVCGIYFLMPETRMVLMPLAVAVVYLLTVAAIFIDSSRVARTLRTSASGLAAQPV